MSESSIRSQLEVGLQRMEPALDLAGLAISAAANLISVEQAMTEIRASLDEKAACLNRDLDEVRGQGFLFEASRYYEGRCLDEDTDTYRYYQAYETGHVNETKSLAGIFVGVEVFDKALLPSEALTAENVRQRFEVCLRIRQGLPSDHRDQVEDDVLIPVVALNGEHQLPVMR